MIKTNSLLFAALLATSPAFAADGDHWLTDFKAAKAQAAAQKKDLLVDFTGSDWCHFCIKLDDEVFSQEEFKTEAPKNYVLVKIDFPQDTSSQSEELQKQNQALQEKYPIQGYPTVFLMDAQGRPYAQTGYQPGGAKDYLPHLKELQKAKTERDAAFAEAEKAEGIAKAKSLVKGLSAVASELHGHYEGVTKMILDSDPGDETGFKALQDRATARMDLEKAYVAAMRAGESDKAITAIDAFLKEHKMEGEELQQTLAMKIDPLINAERYDDALATLEQIKTAAPDTEMGQLAVAFEEKLKAMKAEAEAKKEGEAKAEE